MRLVSVGVTTLALLAAIQARAADEVRIQVDYEFTATQAATGQRIAAPVHWSLGATLIGGNRVVDSWEGRAGRAHDGGTDRSTLGGGRWKVVGPHELQRVTNWPNSETLVHVAVDGQACRATVHARLKPGKTVYVLRSISTGAMLEFTDPQYSNVRCSIR